MFSKTFKCIVIAAIAIFVILCFVQRDVILSGNSARNSRAKSDNRKGYSFQDDVDLVLDRKVFAYAETEPGVYGAIDGIDETPAFAEGWTYRKILCEEYFENIDWILEDYGEKGKQISFVGDSKITGKPYRIDFIIAKGTNEPVACSIDIDNENCANVQLFTNEGISAPHALKYADASASMLVVLATEL